jgi:hypothetical protein
MVTVVIINANSTITLAEDAPPAALEAVDVPPEVEGMQLLVLLVGEAILMLLVRRTYLFQVLSYELLCWCKDMLVEVKEWEDIQGRY